MEYLLYNELLYVTLQLTEEHNFYLPLQVYCSPTLKELLHNTVMTVLACNKERTDSILRAHGVMCACVCVVLCV